MAWKTASTSSPKWHRSPERCHPISWHRRPACVLLHLLVLLLRLPVGQASRLSTLCGRSGVADAVGTCGSHGTPFPLGTTPRRPVAPHRLPIHSPMRRGIKWLCTLLAIAIAFALGASMRWPFSIIHFELFSTPAPREWGLDMGVFLYAEVDVMDWSPLPYGWSTSVTRTQHWVVWTPSWDKNAGSGILLIPLWIPLAVVCLPASLLWRSDIRRARRLTAGHCPSCGYDRRGLAGPCPECGTQHGPA
jgi:hypothetical protein